MEVMMLVLKMIGFWFVSMILSTTVHECGHVVGGLLEGWKFFYLVVGPVRIYRENLQDKIRVGIEKNVSLWGGIGGTIPAKKEDVKISSFGRILLAGPLASMILGVIAAVLGLLLHSLFFLMLMGVALGMGGSCLIPGIKTGILYNDGSRYYRIHRGGQEQAEEEAIFYAAFREYINPDAPYSEDSIQTLLRSKDVEFRYAAHYYAYENAKEAGNAEEMQAQIDAMNGMEKVPAAIRQIYAIEN